MLSLSPELPARLGFLDFDSSFQLMTNINQVSETLQVARIAEIISDPEIVEKELWLSRVEQRQ